MENSARGLTLLEPDHKVVVTGEEHHQPALAGYAPRADGRSRRVAVELGLVAVRGGGRAVEVRLDGRRVGQLTALMSQRYGPLVDDVLRRGERPGAVALVIDGRRGVEVELRLPDAPAGTPAPVPPPAPRPPGRPPNPGPDTGRPAGRRRGRTPLLVGGGVLALLLAVGAAVGGGEDESATNAAATSPTLTAVAPTTTPATRTPTTTTSAPTSSTPTDVDEADVPATAPPATRTRTADPQPQRVLAAPVEPEPEPEPERAPEPEPEAVAVSYQNCDAVRAAGAAPIRRGDPGYSSKLDRDGDGVGCE